MQNILLICVSAGNSSTHFLNLDLDSEETLNAIKRLWSAIYNIDETEFAIKTIKSSCVIINKTLNVRYQAHFSHQKWVNIVEYIYIDKRLITSFIILKREKVMILWVSKSALELNLHFATNAKR